MYLYCIYILYVLHLKVGVPLRFSTFYLRKWGQMDQMGMSIIQNSKASGVGPEMRLQRLLSIYHWAEDMEISIATTYLFTFFTPSLWSTNRNQRSHREKGIGRRERFSQFYKLGGILTSKWFPLLHLWLLQTSDVYEAKISGRKLLFKPLKCQIGVVKRANKSKQSK